ncbi:At1g06900 [Linum perenne]
MWRSSSSRGVVKQAFQFRQQAVEQLRESPKLPTFFTVTTPISTSLSGGVGDDGMHRSSIAYVFGMSIHLTDSGLEKIFEIVGLVYQYLKSLRNVSPQELIFK